METLKNLHNSSELKSGNFNRLWKIWTKQQKLKIDTAEIHQFEWQKIQLTNY